jgi:AcrR family transcriptional regulator
VAIVRTRARKQPAEVRRETLVDAAIRVFARTPYRAAGTAAIAREAGVAEPTIYRHYASKRELYLAALDRTCTEVAEAWQAIIDRTENAGEALGAIGDWYEHSIVANPDPIRLRLRAAAEAEDDEVRALLQHGYGLVVAMVTGVIRRGQEQGSIRSEVDAEAAAWLFMGIGQVLDLSVLGGVQPLEDGCEETMGKEFARYLFGPTA